VDRAAGRPGTSADRGAAAWPQVGVYPLMVLPAVGPHRAASGGRCPRPGARSNAAAWTMALVVQTGVSTAQVPPWAAPASRTRSRPSPWGGGGCGSRLELDDHPAAAGWFGADGHAETDAPDLRRSHRAAHPRSVPPPVRVATGARLADDRLRHASAQRRSPPASCSAAGRRSLLDQATTVWRSEIRAQ